MDFNLPTVEYLNFGNIFSSSLKNFNYKIFPKLEEKKLLVVVWQGRFCFEKSEALFKKEFNLKEDVAKEINLWLKEKHENFSF